MSKVFIINGHQLYPFAKGELNAALVERAHKQLFFAGRSVDDLRLPTHLNAKFYGMEPLPTFAAHDVMKNPDIENDFARFEAHLSEHFPA